MIPGIKDTIRKSEVAVFTAIDESCIIASQDLEDSINNFVFAISTGDDNTTVKNITHTVTSGSKLDTFILTALVTYEYDYVLGSEEEEYEDCECDG